jgi:hypothetical protein
MDDLAYIKRLGNPGHAHAHTPELPWEEVIIKAALILATFVYFLLRGDIPPNTQRGRLFHITVIMCK